jgi:hypothetical protein
MNNRDLIRTVRFRPYRKGFGPTFTLQVFDLGCERHGKSSLGYTLKQHQSGKTTVIFDGDDFGCSPMHGIDEDHTVAAIMGFLTLRKGDTDAEYFENYTPAQTEFSENHAESLSCEVYSRFEKENEA